MTRMNLWSHSVPRAELDQRSREACLRVARIEELLKSRVTARCSRFWQLIGEGVLGVIQRRLSM